MPSDWFRLITADSLRSLSARLEGIDYRHQRHSLGALEASVRLTIEAQSVLRVRFELDRQHTGLVILRPERLLSFRGGGILRPTSCPGKARGHRHIERDAQLLEVRADILRTHGRRRADNYRHLGFGFRGVGGARGGE